MLQTFYDLLDGWTLKWNRELIEIALKDISSYFYERNMTFLLLEQIWDLLEKADNPLEFMTDERKMQLIESLIGDKKTEHIAKYVQLELSETPEYKIHVLNVDDTIERFPKWFEEYEGMPWDDFSSRLLDG